ncbi:MAG TPA: SOS response-associated peptidase [Chryseolinea sp.]|nr:SOS response-associated peptidase [Chryseolinea sp.]HPM29668.1 SOS response-associated peptidase [Chryseolinea sp.]
MIDRYSIAASAEKLKERFSVDVPAFYEQRYNAAPTQLLPVITSSAPQGISTFYWGTSPEWSKNKTLSEKIINVHAEMIHEKASLRKALMKTRCIIPADGFYAWKKAGKKTMIPYRFVATDQELFSIAGLWEEFEDTDGNEHQTFTIITSVANEMVATVQERMPVILNPKSESIWLNINSDSESLTNVLTAYPSGKMNHFPISPRITDPKIDVPSLIFPTPPSDQFGNLTLFD